MVSELYERDHRGILGWSKHDSYLLLASYSEMLLDAELLVERLRSSLGCCAMLLQSCQRV